MEDLISRKAVIETIEQLRQKYYYYRSADSVFLEAEEIINKLPSIENSWIPISKKPPLPYINVLVSYDTGYGGCVDIGYIMNNGNWRMRDNCKLVSGTSVEAWMPLPQEYIWLSDADKKKETECQT